MAEEITSFRRLNFFEGFVTTPEDWNEGELFHVEKHRLHNRAFHGRGVVPGQLKNYHVNARGKGELAVEVQPGYAIDGRGNDIIMLEPEIKQFVKSDFKLPQTVYLVAKFVEELTDFVAYKENLNYKGHTRISERFKIDWSITEPSSETEIEICRIHVTPDAKRFIDPRDPEHPQGNEIDLRYVPLAGVAGGFLGATLMARFRELMRRNRDYYDSLFLTRNIASANNVVQALVMLEMMLAASSVGPDAFVQLVALTLDLQKRVVEEIERNQPGLSSKKKFRDHKSELDLIERLITDQRQAVFVLDDMIKHQESATDSLQATTRDVVTPVDAKQGQGKKGEGFTWDSIKEYSGKMPKALSIGGTDWELMDEIDVLDEKSEGAHNFRIHGEKDSWHTRQRLKYPDGTLVEDAGVAHVDGYAEWEMKGLKPHLDLLILRRMDFVHGDHMAKIEINGRPSGKLVCKGSDKRFRWRNWPVVVKGKYVLSSNITMRQLATTAERDINMFHLWFYQAT